MKHCIIMTAYKGADLINNFLNRVPNDWGVYIHIDKKSSMQPSDLHHGNAIIEKKIQNLLGGARTSSSFLRPS